MPSRRTLFRILRTTAVVVICYWAILFTVQRKLLFRPPLATAAPPRPVDAQQIWLDSPAGKTEAWYLPPLVNASSRNPLLIYCHGNGELIDYGPLNFDEPRRWGMGVLMVEYPGYGRSAGSPSQTSVEDVVKAAYDWAAGQEFIDPAQIVAYGRSLGGGAVCALAAARPVRALILESTFTSTRAFAHQFGGPAFLVLDPFDNVAVLKDFKKPVLVLHGDHDERIPAEHGKTLAATAGVDLHLMHGGHNDCPTPWAVIRQFLEQNKILEPRSGN